MAVIVDLEKCTGCGTCEEICPIESIKVESEKAVVDAETCVDCGTCIEECPEKAVSEATWNGGKSCWCVHESKKV